MDLVSGERLFQEEGTASAEGLRPRVVQNFEKWLGSSSAAEGELPLRVDKRKRWWKLWLFRTTMPICMCTMCMQYQRSPKEGIIFSGL